MATIDIGAVQSTGTTDIGAVQTNPPLAAPFNPLSGSLIGPLTGSICCFFCLLVNLVKRLA